MICIKKITNKITIKATDEASGIVGYAVTENSAKPSSFTSCTSTKSLDVNATNKTQDKTYYVWVKDAAGNISAYKSTSTGSVAQLTTANTTFTYSPNSWTNGSVTVTASSSLATGEFTLQTSKDATNWSDTASQTFTANGAMYVRLVDGTKQAGPAGATANVQNIDKTAPLIASYALIASAILTAAPSP